MMSQQDSAFNKRIVLGGPPRAGSTLTRWILDRSSTILSGPETNFFLLPLGQTQSRAERIAGRVAEKLELPANNVAADIFNSADSFAAFDRIMDRYGARVGVFKTGWAEKTPSNCYHYHRLAAENPAAYFVSVIRNGLDIVTSRIDDHPRRAGEYWCSVQRYIDSMRCVASFDHPKHHVLRYEDLVNSPEETTRRLFDFLQIPFEPSTLAEHESMSATRDLAKVHQAKLALPIQSTWVDRWRRPEHKERVAEFNRRPDALAWQEYFGYAAAHGNNAVGQQSSAGRAA